MTKKKALFEKLKSKLVGKESCKDCTPMLPPTIPGPSDSPNPPKIECLEKSGCVKKVSAYE